MYIQAKSQHDLEGKSESRKHYQEITYNGNEIEFKKIHNIGIISAKRNN